MGKIIIYNTKTEDFTSHPNNVYIGRPSILSNPYTHDGKRSSLAKLTFKTREEAIEAYKLYFDAMYEQDDQFKQAVDLKLSVATSGFLTVPNERNSESTLGSLGRCLCEGLLGMKKDIAASAVLNCVLKNVNY